MALFDWLRRKWSPDESRSDDGDAGHSEPSAAVPGDRQWADEDERPEQLGPERSVLYMFQHVALREAAFENHPS